MAGLPANATPARVINMSLGGGGACDTTSQTAINAARSRGDIIGQPHEFLIFAGLVYFLISFSASLLVKHLQKRLAV